METQKTEKEMLRRLPIDCLWEGLVIKDNLYNHTGETLLLPKGEQLTADRIRRLYNFNRGDQNIMIYEDVYYDILTDEHITPEVRQQLTEAGSGYRQLAQNVGGMLRNAEAWLKNDELETLVQEISEKLVVIDPVTIFSCINFPRPMDEGLQRHSLNVAFMNGMIGRWMELPQKDIRMLVMAGLLHDIGKTKIPEEILNADRKLTPEEFAALHTRVLAISRETRTANAIGDLNGAIDAMPKKAVTIGMAEILGAKKIRLGVFRDWHRSVVRQAAYGEVSAHFPATLIQRHPDAMIIVNANAAKQPF